MEQLKIEVQHDHPDGTARYWLDGDVIVVQAGIDLEPLQVRRLVRDARRAYGVEEKRRRGVVPVALLAGGVGNAVRSHPTTSTVLAGALTLSLAAGALYGAQLGDGHHPHRRPPAVAGPAPTPGPPTATRPRRPRTGPPTHPGQPTGPVRSTPRTSPPTTEPVADRPTPTPGPSTVPPADGGPTSPATTPSTTPPSSHPPPTTSPPARERCVLHLAALGVVDVRLLCY